MTHSSETAEEQKSPQPPRRQWAVTGFRWIVSGLDLALGLGLSLLGILLLFGHSSWHVFVRFPNGWLGILFVAHGIWSCVSGMRLITEQPPMCWQVGKRRHLIAATLSGLIIALLWLAMLAESAMYSLDGFGSSMAVLLYTLVFGCAIGFLLIVSLVMAMIHRKWRADITHDSRTHKGVAIHINDWKRAGIAVFYGACVWAVLFGITLILEWQFNAPAPEQGFGPVYHVLSLFAGWIPALYLGWIPALIVAIWKFRSSRGRYTHHAKTTPPFGSLR